jgi:hypothetical protein
MLTDLLMLDTPIGEGWLKAAWGIASMERRDRSILIVIVYQYQQILSEL